MTMLHVFAYHLLINGIVSSLHFGERAHTRVCYILFVISWQRGWLFLWFVQRREINEPFHRTISLRDNHKNDLNAAKRAISFHFLIIHLSSIVYSFFFFSRISFASSFTSFFSLLRFVLFLRQLSLEVVESLNNKFSGTNEMIRWILKKKQNKHGNDILSIRVK